MPELSGYQHSGMHLPSSPSDGPGSELAHDVRLRAQGYDTDDDLSMGRVSDFSVEPSQESSSGAHVIPMFTLVREGRHGGVIRQAQVSGLNLKPQCCLRSGCALELHVMTAEAAAAGYPHGGAETQHTLQNAAGRLDSATTADSSGDGSKHSPEPQPCTAAGSPAAISDIVGEPPSQPSLRSQASLARDVTLGKPGMPFDGQLCSAEHDDEAVLETADSRCLASGSDVAEPQRMGSAEGTEMLTMSCNSQQADVAALLCSSPPREAWPSILLQPQPQSAPAQPPVPASMQLLDSSAPAAATPFTPPPGPVPDEKPLLAHAPFGSSVLPRAVANPAAQGEAATVPDPLAPQHGAAQHEAAAYARVPSKDMMATPSRLSRASSARCGDASQPLPPAPLSTAAERSSPPSLAAVAHAREDGRAAGTRDTALAAFRTQKVFMPQQHRAHACIHPQHDRLHSAWHWATKPAAGFSHDLRLAGIATVQAAGQMWVKHPTRAYWHRRHAWRCTLIAVLPGRGDNVSARQGCGCQGPRQPGLLLAVGTGRQGDETAGVPARPVC